MEAQTGAAPARDRSTTSARGAGPAGPGEPWLARLLHRPLATVVQSGAEIVRIRALPALPQLLMSAHLASLTAAAIDFQMRHASIPAMARVVRRLGVDADWVVFGHVHRVGPLPGEETEQWGSPGGSPRFVNTGSWLYEPLLVDRGRPTNPYWPGGAVMLEPSREPRAVGLLDGLSPRQLGARD